MFDRPVLLMILDGFGINNNELGNAIKHTPTPNFDKIMREHPHTVLHTSGLDVGLPDGQMGNSEVGHMNIGAGRVVYQDLTRITKSINDGDFFDNKAFLNAIDNSKKNNSSLHLYGLVSDGGVHSHITHLYALLRLAKEKGLEKVYVHCFLDGRDTPPASAKGFIEALESKMRDIGVGKIASIMGRYYVMDRDKRWERVKLAYDVLVSGKGETANSAVEAVEKSYANDKTDEFVLPTVILENGQPVATIKENDSIIFFNFRGDRARQITRAFIDKEFDGFEREKAYFPVYYICMAEYDKTFENVEIAFKPQNLENTLGQYLSNKGYTQLRIAETEKYAHVTFFFNGGVEKQYEGEERTLIQSPKVATYDLKPDMSAYEVTNSLVQSIKSGKFSFILLNFANCDMVGHTGIFEAACKAVATVDECMGRVIDAMNEKNGIVLVTADHGNAEQMIDYNTGEPHTAHTTNVVPLVIVNGGEIKLREGKLADISPTILELMKEDIPGEMTGTSLIIK